MTSSFASNYLKLCEEKKIKPLPMVCLTLPHSLDFTIDRLKIDDWLAITDSLSSDRSLRSISMRNKCKHRKCIDHANAETKARAVTKTPVILTRYLLEKLSHSLAQCIRSTSILTRLELEGLPFPTDCVVVLSHGIASTKSLQYVSLQRCRIGDKGCEIICRTIAEVQCVRTLNLGWCDLTESAGPALASALSRQNLSLYHDAWKQSLRYREPQLESMPGLRRLTLNGNSKLGNEGVLSIIDAIRDSLWMKALDLQQCGLTDDMCREIFQLLEQNQTLVVVDVRQNSGIRADSLNEIARRLKKNELRYKSNEYHWLDEPQQQKKSASSVRQQRICSADNIGKQLRKSMEDGKRRPRSAMVRQLKRPPMPIIYRKPLLMPLPSVIGKIRTKSTKSALTGAEKRVRQPMKPPPRSTMHHQIKNSEKVDSLFEPYPQPPLQHPTATPKISLHLDLQSQLKTLSDSSQNIGKPTVVGENIVVPNISENPPEPTVVIEPSISMEVQRLQQVLRELLESQEEREKLADDKRRLELQLAEEKARREFAESKLQATRVRLSELEESVRQRERYSRGRLTISQKSLEELYLTFNLLSKMYEESSLRRSSHTNNNNDEDDDDASTDSEEEYQKRESIKRQFNMIVRKTKSENLKRGNCFADEDRLLPRSQLTARYGRSEGNIRTTSIEPPPQPIRMLEQCIGDTLETPRATKATDAMMPQQQVEVPNYDKRGRDDVRLLAMALSSGQRLMPAGDESTPGDRARTLFANLVNGNALLGINSHLSR